MSAREDLLGKDFDTLIDGAVDAEFEVSERKRDMWRKVGECLIFAGYPRRTLSVEIGDRIERRIFERHGYVASIRTTYYYECMREWKWNSKAAPVPEHLTEATPAEIQSVMDDEPAYIGYDPPETGVDNSSLNSNYTVHAVENKRLIDLIGDFTGALYDLRTYARENPFLSKVEGVDLEDIFIRMNAWVMNCRDTLNAKQLIPVNAQPMILQFANSSSDINNLFGMLFDEIKRIHIIDRVRTKKDNQILTRKEMKRYQNREIKNLSSLLEPQTANEARMSGFYGQKCTECGGYRTTLAEGNPNRVTCIKCIAKEENVGMPREIFLSCQRCRLLIDNPNSQQCNHCGHEYTIPKEMKSTAK